MDETFDVLVIGGGPAGSSAAASCARRGLRVGLIEHKRFPRHKVCGDVINPHCWPVLDRLGAGDRLRQTALQIVSGVVIATTDGRSVTVPGRLTALPRSVFDLCLLETARAAGVAVIQGELARRLTPGWTVDTGIQRRGARVVIGADGRQSVVAHLAGLQGAHRVRGPGTGVIALQAHYPAPRTLDDRVYLHLFPGGYSGMVRVGAAEVNLCIVAPAALARCQAEPADLFARTVELNPRFRELGVRPHPLTPLRGAAPLRRANNRPVGAGVFLAGDALRVTEPFSGQGMYFALRTGELAAAAVADAGLDYAAATAALYRQRARTNRWLRRLLYRERLARGVLAGLARCPLALNWLAANVLAE